MAAAFGIDGGLTPDSGACGACAQSKCSTEIDACKTEDCTTCASAFAWSSDRFSRLDRRLNSATRTFILASKRLQAIKDKATSPHSVPELGSFLISEKPVDSPAPQGS